MEEILVKCTSISKKKKQKKWLTPYYLHSTRSQLSSDGDVKTSEFKLRIPPLMVHFSGDSEYFRGFVVIQAYMSGILEFCSSILYRFQQTCSLSLVQYFNGLISPFKIQLSCRILWTELDSFILPMIFHVLKKYGVGFEKH